MSVQTALRTALAFTDVELSVRLVPQERIHERVVEQAVALSVPQMKEAVVELTQPVPCQRSQERVEEQIVGFLVLPLQEEIVPVGQSTPQERSPERIAKQIVDIPVPLVVEESMAVGQEEVVLAPTDRVQQPTIEQIDDVPLFLEETVEMVRLVPQERVQWIDEQMVKVPIPTLTW